jgi:hypothetical protein
MVLTMATSTVITITGTDPDGLRSLRSWLAHEDELRGRVALSGQAPAPGSLGVLAEVLTVSLSSGGAISVLVASTMSWLRQRQHRRHSASTATLKLHRADGASIEISAAALGAWSAAEVAAQVRLVATALESGTPPGTPAP